MRNFVVTVNGKTYNVGVEEVGEGESVRPIVKEIKQAESAKPVGNANGTKVLSPFPGLIKNLLVAEGATVKKDQPILVLEAMKMDNDVVATCDGKVSFNVQKGATVESESVLAFIS